MTSGKRRLAANTDIVHELRGPFRRLALVPRVVDHDHRRAVTRAEALYLEQRERSVRVGLARLEARLRPQFLAQDNVRQTCSTNLPTGRV